MTTKTKQTTEQNNMFGNTFFEDFFTPTTHRRTAPQYYYPTKQQLLQRQREEEEQRRIQKEYERRLLQRELEKRELESMKKKKMPSNIESILSELGGTLKARIYDEKMDILKEVPVSDITKELDAENMHTVIFDGIITQRLIDMVEAKDIKIIAGVKIGNVFRKPEKLEIYVKEE